MDNSDLRLELVELAFCTNDKIRGHLSYLDEKRLVFIGENKDDPNTYYVGFRNSEGQDTKLRLSFDAMAMLVQLYNKKQKGDDVFPLQIKNQWQISVKEGEIK